MNSRRGLILAVFSLVLAATLVGTIAYADQFDQAMKLTFGQPIMIPDKVLPAGTYWFVRDDHGDDPSTINVIHVFDADRKNIIATVDTGAAQRVQGIDGPSGKIRVTLADRSPKPDVLLTLTYPGVTDGYSFEIVYPAQQRKQFSELPKVRMRVSDNGSTQLDRNNKSM